MILPLIAFVVIGFQVEKFGPEPVKDLPLEDPHSHKEMMLLLDEFEKDGDKYK